MNFDQLMPALTAMPGFAALNPACLLVPSVSPIGFSWYPTGYVKFFIQRKAENA